MSKQIFLGRLPKHSSNRDLENIFLPYRKMTHCELKQGMYLAYGFVEFEDIRMLRMSSIRRMAESSWMLG